MLHPVPYIELCIYSSVFLLSISCSSSEHFLLILLSAHLYTCKTLSIIYPSGFSLKINRNASQNVSFHNPSWTFPHELAQSRWTHVSSLSSFSRSFSGSLQNIPLSVYNPRCKYFRLASPKYSISIKYCTPASKSIRINWSCQQTI